MKSRFPLVLLWVLFCLTSFAVVDCTKSDEKNLASGYTEEGNAWNGLDSTLAKLLETWESEVSSDSVERHGTGEAQGKTWYEVEFLTEGEVVYVEQDDSSNAVVVLSVYERENALQLKVESESKKYNYTQMLERDSIFAVAVDRLDNSYAGDGIVENCRADSLEFVQECSGASGVFTDQYMLEKCTELHLVCRKSFEVSMSADDYLAATAKRLKDRYSAEETVVSNTLVDPRDGKVYRTVEIGGLTWMAENLNYAYVTPTALWDSTSFCYDDDPAMCETHGRLYTYSAIVDSTGLLSDANKGCGYMELCNLGRNVQGICPDGWRIPNYDEITALVEAVGGSSVAGRNLKTVEYGGTDSVGFSLLMSGRHIEFQRSSGTYVYEFLGNEVDLWSVTETGVNEILTYKIFNDYDYVGRTVSSKYTAHPLRCVKGEASKLALGQFDPESVVVGAFTDDRDGTVYKTVQIADQVWMAEYLRYAADGAALCYDNLEENCTKYGMLYPAAPPTDSTEEGHIQSYCPDGWRLPLLYDFDSLAAVIGPSFKAIKSVEGWMDDEGNGTDEYGLNILPGGYGRWSDSTLVFTGVGEGAYIWTSRYTGGVNKGEILVVAPKIKGATNSSSYLAINVNDYAYIRCIKD